jgi:16S rRNA (cytosine967-C5)-methyltransferase
MSARLLAVRVLSRVARDAAFASASLDAELERAAMPTRDAALATEIVYGTLRHLTAIDAAIDAKLKRGGKVDAFVRAVLRAAVYQLTYLDRTPARAVVHDSVAITRSERGDRVAAFVNAVLRGVMRDAKDTAPVVAMVPPFLVEAFEAALGKERAALLIRPEETPSLDVRVALHVSIDALAERIRAYAPRATVVRGKVATRCLKLHGAGDPRRLPGHETGELAVQEEGAQAIAELVAAKPGERIADVCAGRGGKTVALAETVGESGEVVAIDVHEGRLAQIAEGAKRLGLKARITTEAIDLSVGTGGLTQPFDRVLVDAPCTGLGTWWRRPELLARIEPTDPARLATLARSILEGASKLVAAHGSLVFSVCSPMLEEGPLAVANLPGFRIVPFAGELGLSSDADGVLRLGPWLGTDAYQIIRFERV